MPEPVDPTPPPPPVPSFDSGPASEPSTLDLPPNIAAALACIPLVGGIIFYILEKRNSFVRFYALQSIVLGGLWLLFLMAFGIVYFIFSHLPLIGLFLAILWYIIGMVIDLAFVAVWVVATFKAFTNVRWEIPYIGPVARKGFPNAHV